MRVGGDVDRLDAAHAFEIVDLLIGQLERHVDLAALQHRDAVRVLRNHEEDDLGDIQRRKVVRVRLDDDLLAGLPLGHVVGTEAAGGAVDILRRPGIVRGGVRLCLGGIPDLVEHAGGDDLVERVGALGLHLEGVIVNDFVVFASSALSVGLTRIRQRTKAMIYSAIVK